MSSFRSSFSFVLHTILCISYPFEVGVPKHFVHVERLDEKFCGHFSAEALLEVAKDFRYPVLDDTWKHRPFAAWLGKQLCIYGNLEAQHTFFSSNEDPKSMPHLGNRAQSHPKMDRIPCYKCACLAYNFSFAAAFHFVYTKASSKENWNNYIKNPLCLAARQHIADKPPFGAQCCEGQLDMVSSPTIYASGKWRATVVSLPRAWLMCLWTRPRKNFKGLTANIPQILQDFSCLYHFLASLACFRFLVYN